MVRPRSRSATRRSSYTHNRGRAFFFVSGSLIVVALVLFGLLVNNLSRPADSSSSGKARAPKTSRRADGSKSISTQAAKAAAPSSTAPTVTQLSPLGPAAISYLSSRMGTATAAVYDISTGQTWYLHPGDLQDTASIVKVDIMGTLMAQSQTSSQPIAPDQQSLLTSMIEVSDNDAATALWNSVGGPAAIGAFNASIGMTETTPSSCLTCEGFAWPGWGLTTTTAADQIILLRHLILPNSGINSSERSEALDLLENVTASERWGVTGGVPPGVTVALKNGWVPLPDSLWQINSIGWINGDGRDYLLAVLTDGNPTEDYGIDTIDTLAGLVWTALAPQS